MRRSLLLNSRALFVPLGLSTLLGLVMSSTYANPDNTSTYSDAIFAANAVKAPVVHDEEDGYYSYNYRRRFAEIRAAKQQTQRISEEQRSQDVQISAIPRINESDLEYQIRMEKEQNPVWLKHQAQAKLQAQIFAQQEEKQNQKLMSMTSNSTPPLSGNSLPTNSLNTTKTAKTSLDSIPRTMSMGKYVGYSLFYSLGIVWSLIFFVGLLRRRNE
jgi:hypothetical protein